MIPDEKTCSRCAVVFYRRKYGTSRYKFAKQKYCSKVCAGTLGKEKAKAYRVVHARKCKNCKNTLGSDRYFQCMTCQPQLPQDISHFIIEYT